MNPLSQPPIIATLRVLCSVMAKTRKATDERTAKGTTK
jgi:hypothetical protein